MTSLVSTTFSPQANEHKEIDADYEFYKKSNVLNLFQYINIFTVS